MANMKLKKGDKVVVIAGKDKAKRARSSLLTERKTESSLKVST